MKSNSTVTIFRHLSNGIFHALAFITNDVHKKCIQIKKKCSGRSLPIDLGWMALLFLKGFPRWFPLFFFSTSWLHDVGFDVVFMNRSLTLDAVWSFLHQVSWLVTFSAGFRIFMYRVLLQFWLFPYSTVDHISRSYGKDGSPPYMLLSACKKIDAVQN